MYHHLESPPQNYPLSPKIEYKDNSDWYNFFNQSVKGIIPDTPLYSDHNPIIDISIDPENDSVAYFGVFDKGILMTSNGGSTVEEFETESIVVEIKKQTEMPVILFPGDVTQLTEEADGLLFLSLSQEERGDE